MSWFNVMVKGHVVTGLGIMQNAARKHCEGFLGKNA